MPPPGTEVLHQAVVEAVVALLDATGAAGFCIPLPDTAPTVYVAVGEPREIRLMLPDSANDRFA